MNIFYFSPPVRAIKYPARWRPGMRRRRVGRRRKKTRHGNKGTSYRVIVEGDRCSRSGSILFFAQEGKFIDYHFRDGAFDAFLVFVAPVSQFAPDDHFFSFFEEAADEFGGFAESDDVVPLGGGDLVAVGIAVDFVGCHAEAGERFTAFEGPGFGIFSQVADQQDAVFNAVHDKILLMDVIKIESA